MPSFRTPSATTALLNPVGAGWELVGATNPLATVGYYWNDDTWAFDVATAPTAGSGGEVYVTNFPATQAISAVALPLPNGAASEDTIAKLTPASSSSTSNISGSASSQTFLSLNASRKGFVIYNDSDATLYIKYGTTASATSYTEKLYSNGSYSETGYAGRVDGVWSSATGTARITELS